jgi:hypothetical protein
VLGQKIVVGKAVCTVVGVLKKDQILPAFFYSEIFRPLAYTVNPATPWDPTLNVFVRSQPGATRMAAETALARAKVAWPPNWDPNAGEQKPTLSSLPELQKWNHPEIYWMLFGAVGFLYGIACLNATNLLLVRQLGRKRELSIRLALAETRYRDMYHERFALSVLEVLSAIALFLTVVGLFSVLTYTVDRRMNEFGVRLALGATAGDLMMLIIGRGVLFTGIGIAGGIGGALALTRFLQSLLYRTPPYDPMVFGAVAVLLLLAATASSAVPALRASRAEVARLLRAE